MNRTTVSRPHPARLRLGVGMIVASLVGALFAGLTGAASAAESEAKPLEISKSAYWTNSLGHVSPNVLLSRFPPQAVCLVVPPFCTSDAEEITDAGEDSPVPVSLNDTVQGNQPKDHVPVTPLDTIMAGGPDSGNLPTAVIAGARRYQSAIQFDVPALADDEQFSKFEVVLTETTPTYHFDSPAFRQFVTGVLALARQDTAELPKTPEREPASEVPLGIEACPLTVNWEAGENQDGADAPDRDDFERSADGTETLEPEIDCGFGANGQHQADGTWVFDLTDTANAWAAGDLPNMGVFLRPVNPPNLAYGDPDLSTWDQVTFAGPSAEDGVPAFVAETEEVAPLVTFDSDFGTGSSDSVVMGSTATQPESFTEVFGSPGSAPADSPAPAPTQASGGDDFVAAPVGLSNPVTEWWVWLLVPLLLGGMYLVSQAFTAEAAVAHERSGAMTRLLAQRRAAGLE